MDNKVAVNKSNAEMVAGITKIVDIFQTTGTAVTLTVNKALVLDSTGKIKTSTVTEAELDFISGLTSNAQVQLGTKANINNSVFTGTMEVGVDTGANYDHVQFIAAQGVTGHTYAGYLGITGEVIADVSHTAAGVGGNAKTYGTSDAKGIVGVGKVSATGDTADSIGVEGRSLDTHASGDNIAIRAYASGGANNYSFKGNTGKIINAEAIISGDGTNNITIDPVAGLKLNGTSTNFVDLLPIQCFASPSNGASLTAYNGNLAAYEFVNNTTKAIQVIFEMPHGYKEGSNIVPHLHLYTPAGTGTGIKLFIEYTWTNIDSTGAVSTTPLSPTITFTTGVVQNNLVYNFGSISGAGMTISSIFSCRIWRDNTDDSDFSASIWLKSVDIHCEVDTIGSATITVK
jgi:hypothetical protein